MSFITLLDKIISVLNSIDDIQEVSEYPNQQFTGFPAVMVSGDGNTSDYETTCENKEVYAFSLFAFYDLEFLKAKKSWRVMLELCDTIRDTFDNDEFLNGILMPDGRVLLGVRPTVSQIAEDDSGKYVVAKIDLAIQVSKKVN